MLNVVLIVKISVLEKTVKPAVAKLDFLVIMTDGETVTIHSLTVH